MIISSAIYYYHATNATIDAQQGVLLGLNRLSAELTESNMDSISIYPGGGTATQGIVFASPRRDTGNYVFDEFGRLLWQRRIGYSISKVSDHGKEITALLRKAELLATPTVAVPSPLPLTTDLGAFAPGVASKVIGRYVTTIAIERGPATATSSTRTLKVTLTAETFYRDSFSCEAQTSVLLRN